MTQPPLRPPANGRRQETLYRNRISSQSDCTMITANIPSSDTSVHNDRVVFLLSSSPTLLGYPYQIVFITIHIKHIKPFSSQPPAAQFNQHGLSHRNHLSRGAQHHLPCRLSRAANAHLRLSDVWLLFSVPFERRHQPQDKRRRGTCPGTPSFAY